MKEVYLRFTEEINAFDYLEKSYYFIKKASRDKYAWKWVALSLHGALYGFAVCACRGTSDIGIVYENKKKIKRLISFNKALEKCQNPEVMKMTICSKWLVLTKSQEESIRQLKECLRNKFEHYQYQQRKREKLNHMFIKAIVHYKVINCIKKLKIAK